MNAAGDDAVEKPLQAGCWVRHYGTRRWGEVLEVVPQHDRTLEIKVQPEEGLCEGDANEPTWWASYHVDKADD